MTASAVNPWELAARADKAAAIVAFLTAEYGRDALRAAEVATETQWEAIGLMAGVLRPSEKTRKRVREILQAEVTRRALGLGS